MQYTCDTSQPHSPDNWRPIDESVVRHFHFPVLIWYTIVHLCPSVHPLKLALSVYSQTLVCKRFFLWIEQKCVFNRATIATNQSFDFHGLRLIMFKWRRHLARLPAVLRVLQIDVSVEKPLDDSMLLYTGHGRWDSWGVVGWVIGCNRSTLSGVTSIVFQHDSQMTGEKSSLWRKSTHNLDEGVR